MANSEACPAHQEVHEEPNGNKRKSHDLDRDDDTVTSYPPSVKREIPDRLTSLIPPTNFGAVDDGNIYRSSFPLPENFTFLRSLKLKTVLTLIPEPFPPEYTKFMRDAGMTQIVVPLPANKDHVRVESDAVNKALSVALDRSYHPLLIHCNKGKHRTGCLIGSIRKVQGESMPEILSEYHAYADPKARSLDEAFLKNFDERKAWTVAAENGYVTDDEGRISARRKVMPGGTVYPLNRVSDSGETSMLTSVASAAVSSATSLAVSLGIKLPT